MVPGKIGAQFEYSITCIQFLGFLKIRFKIGYRTVQGIVRGLSDYNRIEEIHFTQIRRRILKIKPYVRTLNLDIDDDEADNADSGCFCTYYNKERRLHRAKMD